MTEKYFYRVAGVLKNPCNPSARKAGAYQQSMSNLEDAGIVAVELEPQDTVVWNWDNYDVFDVEMDHLA